MASAETWHLITPEYPPQLGGVADYTLQVAGALRLAGQAVHVWTPSVPESAPETTVTKQASSEDEVNVHRIPGGMTPGNLRRLHTQLESVSGPRRLLVQWVPHGYGYRSMNVPFCLWLWKRARRGDVIDLMVHEPFLRFREGSWRQDAAAAVHRLMVSIVLQAAQRVWVSTPDWTDELRPWAFGKDLGFKWLPVPNNIPVRGNSEEIAAVREGISSPGQTILGHFGTFAPGVCAMLGAVLPQVLRNRTNVKVVLLGPGSREFRERLISDGTHGERLLATGSLPLAELSLYLSTCDLLLQPYPDGVNGRRSSTMAALAHGKPVITTNGRATEPVWAQMGLVSLSAAGDLEDLRQRVEALLDGEAERRELGARGLACYHELFEVERLVHVLLATPKHDVGLGKKQCAF